MQGKWSEHEARGVLAAWKKSGLTLERFAKERGIVPQRMRHWRKKLEAPPTTTTALAKAEPELKLLPVEVAAPKRGEPVAVYLRSGHIVRVGRGFDEQAFTRVMAILDGA